MDLLKIDNMEFDFDPKDFPEFSDAMIISADYDGEPMSDEELDELNQNSEFVYEKLMDFLF